MSFLGLDLNKFEPYINEARTHLQNAVHVLKCIYQSNEQGNGLAARNLRTLEYQFGMVPSETAERFTPRLITTLPYVAEAVTTERVELFVEQEHGRPVTAGFYANIGEAPFKVALVGVDGRTTAEHTLPAGSTIQISCAIARVIVVPIEAQESAYQVYGY